MKPARTCTIRTTCGLYPVGIGLLLLFVLIGLALYLTVLGLPTILYFLAILYLVGPVAVFAMQPYYGVPCDQPKKWWQIHFHAWGEVQGGTDTVPPWVECSRCGVEDHWSPGDPL